MFYNKRTTLFHRSRSLKFHAGAQAGNWNTLKIVCVILSVPYLIWYSEIIKLLLSRAPPGCLQYFTGVRSTVESFNWDGTTACSTGCFLRQQAYRVCFRPEKGSFFFLIILFLQLSAYSNWYVGRMLFFCFRYVWNGIRANRFGIILCWHLWHDWRSNICKGTCVIKKFIL